MRCLYDGLNREEAETFGLVLLSSKIVHDIRQEASGWEIWVPASLYETAETLLDTYQAENKDPQPAKDVREDIYHRTWAGVAGAAVLLIWQVIIFYGQDISRVHRLYGSSARYVVDGEWYRCATALMLHVDALHLVGNLVGMTLFATAVCSVSGWGIGWLLILAAGIGGNLINAFVYGSGHNAIGASTAVFGALGLLSAYQFLKKLRHPHNRFQILLPIGAGLALLAFLGSSAHTDIMAHLFGFICGIILGLIYYGYVARPLPIKWQTAALLSVVFVLAAAWLRPVMGG